MQRRNRIIVLLKLLSSTGVCPAIFSIVDMRSPRVLVWLTSALWRARTSRAEEQTNPIDLFRTVLRNLSILFLKNMFGMHTMQEHQ